MIPKILHYVWLGGGEPSETIKHCFKSWEKHLSDYKVMRWDEKSFDISKAPLFVRQAYEAKKWAFAADFIRCWALFDYGGLYLDTDVEVLKSMDIFLENRLFISTQVFPIDVSKKEKKIVTNLSIGVIGSEIKHPYMLKCMESIERLSFLKKDGTPNTTVINYTMSTILENEYGFKVEDKQQTLEDGIVVYPSSFFSDRLAPNKSTDPYTYHWGEMSWFQAKPRGLFYKTCWNLNIMGFYHWIEKKLK